MEPEGSLTHSQVPASCPYPEPDKSSPCLPPHFLKIHLNIIHLRLSLPIGLFPSDFPNKTLYTLLLYNHPCYMLHPSHSSLLDHPHNIW